MIHLNLTQREGQREVRTGERFANSAAVVGQRQLYYRHHDDHCDHDEHSAAQHVYALLHLNLIVPKLRARKSR